MTACANCGQENPEGFRFCGACGAELVAAAEAPREARKTVTVLFCDVAGSTALGERLDPESLRRVMARYFETARAALERHGGTVEKFIGDAVMAVFGIPAVREDDALRAVRAAAELRAGLAGLNVELERGFGITLQARIGVNTGEVVTGTEERLATGDAVNVAARLEQAAASGEVLLGAGTYALVRDAVEAEEVDPLPAKGKEHPLEAFRLVAVHEGAPGYARRLDAPLVGRVDELAQLRSAFERAARERTCYLFTLLGPPGIGKSRLVAELAASLGERAHILTGRCLSYGEGIAFWPLVEMAHALDGGGENSLERALSLPAAAPEETFWAVRRSLETLAAERPLLLVLDDFHWAEGMLLDLVEHVADLSREAPMALVCVARPELLDERPGWGGGKLNATAMLLEPLGEAESEQLVDELLAGATIPAQTRARVVAAAEGNPLFLEQMVAYLGEDGGGSNDTVLPPTIHALVSARLDRLASDERAVLERASVVGKEFTVDALAALSPPGAELRRPLEALVRKEFLRSQGDGDLRFRSLLIRDAAYESLPKQLRAELHERFGDWLGSAYADRMEEVEEILGYHLEQAYRLRAELGPIDDMAVALAARAGEHLAASGLRAYHRFDIAAAVGLLGRAIALVPAREPELLPVLGDALIESGDLPGAEAVLNRALGVAADDHGLQARARCGLLRLRLQTDPEMPVAEARLEVERLVPLLEARGDDLGLTTAWQLVGLLDNMSLQFAAMQTAYERALLHARRAGSGRDEAESLFCLGLAVAMGPIPLEEAIPICESLRADARGWLAERFVDASLAVAHGLAGRSDQARDLLAGVRRTYGDMGMQMYLGGTSIGMALVEFGAADPVAAERALREGIEILDQMGETAYLSTAAAMLAQALNDQGRHDEALEQTHISEANTTPGDLASEIGWRAERARAFARRGELPQAERLAREACDLTRETDTPHFATDALFALAEVLSVANRRDEAARVAEAAVELYRRKGAAPDVWRARMLLAGT